MKEKTLTDLFIELGMIPDLRNLPPLDFGEASSVCADDDDPQKEEKSRE